MYLILKILFIGLFVASALSCKKEESINPKLQNTRTEYIKIEGNWLLYQYQVSPTSNLIVKNDTLQFVSETSYYYNNILSNYELIPSNSMCSSYRLYLKNTAFGNILGTVPDNFQTIGEMNGVSFSPNQTSSTNGLNYILWLRKI